MASTTSDREQSSTPGSDHHTRAATSENTRNCSDEITRRDDINVVLSQIAIEGPPPTGGCVVRSFSGQGDMSWANWSTPLHMALSRNARDVAISLLEQGFKIDFLNAIGRTALHEAVKASKHDDVKFLLGNGADPACESEARWFKDNDGVMRGGPAGVTPLHEAIGVGDTRLVKMLLREWVLPSTKPVKGWTLADVALVDEQHDILALLLGHGFQLSAHLLAQGHEASTICEKQQQPARQLLEHDSVIPLNECYETYLHLLSISQAQTKTDPGFNPQLYAAELVAAFSKALRNAANVPDLHCFTKQYCTHCQELQQRTFYPSKEIFKHCPNMKSLMASAEQGCELCKVFADALQHGQQKSSIYDPQVTIKLSIPSFVAHANRNLILSCEDTSTTLNLFFLQDDVINEILPMTVTTEGGSLTVPATDLSYRTVRQWIQTCSQHEDCRSANQSVTKLPSRVINVGNDSQEPFLYVSSGEESHYCALSYCWGDKLPFKTTKANVESCQSRIPLELLPQTIRDAIIVTRNLNFTYLWIDCICIIQDDRDDWLAETAYMDRIFADAALTISPSDAVDCNGGCFHESKYRINRPVPISLSLPRYYKSRVEPGCNSLCVLPFQANDSSTGWRSRKLGPVDERGWILQEQMLAPRMLYYSEGMAFWQCSSLSASEADPTAKSHLFLSISNEDREIRKTKLAIAACDGGLDADAREGRYLIWQKLVADYTVRKLSHTTDKIIALMGLNSRIGRALQDESIAGIWKGSYCLRSLLWAVNKKHQKVTAERLDFPSWSWASVSSPITYPYTSIKSMTLQTSDVTFDVQSDRSQSSVSGTIRLKGTLRVFRDLDIGRCHNSLWNPLMSHLTEDDMDKPEEKLMEELNVVEGYKDYISDNHEEVWCLVIGRIPIQEPPKFGYPAFPGGRPPSIVCLCLKPVDLTSSIFRRFGLCELWDSKEFWEEAKYEQEVLIA